MKTVNKSIAFVILFLLIFSCSKNYDFISTENEIYVEKSEQDSCGKKILLFSTEAVSDRPSGNYLGIFDDLPGIINEYGYFIDIHEKFYDGNLSEEVLGNYDQLWLMATNRDKNTFLSDEEIDLIYDFVNTGGGLLIAAEHEDVYDYTDDVNGIANLLGVNFFGYYYEAENVPVYPNFTPNIELTVDLESITGYRSVPDMSVSNSEVKIASTYNNRKQIAYIDDDIHIVFDRSCVTFSNLYGQVNDDLQYILNVAGFLERDSCNNTSEIIIDIKPGSIRNPINLNSNGVIPVAILSDDNFDATSLTDYDIRFGPDNASKSHENYHIKDVDKDGDLDLLVHFRTQETGIQPGDEFACISVFLNDEVLFTGCDIIDVIQ